MVATPARTAFFGTPETAVPFLAVLHSATTVEAVVTRPDKPRGRSGTPRPPAVKEAAQAWDLNVLQPVRAPQVAPMLVGLDLVVVVAYGQLLPADLLSIPRHGFVNVHFSALPRWRGAAPVARAILAGDETTGVDVMQLDSGMDTGDLIARRQVAIDPTDTTGSLTARLAGIGAALLSETLPSVLAGTAGRVPQDSEGVVTAGKLSPHEGRLFPRTMTAESCDRLVRAFNPNPGAWGVVDGERLKVWQSRPRPDTVTTAGESETGGDSPVVGAVGGSLELLEVQAAGKSRMSGAMWARGHRGAFRWD